MTSIPKYLAEGTFGCVHNPSLICKNRPNFIYNDKVSKILLNSEKIKELKEYKLISKADKYNNFHLGKPESCLTSRNASNISAIGNCPKLGNKILSNFNDHSLIIMKDGGFDLKEYGDKMKDVPITSYFKDKAEIFWLECHRLFLGIQTMLKHNVIHNDIKASNIVYSDSKNRVNFIDFGLMLNKKEIIEKRKLNMYKERNHWSYPFEYSILNKQAFNKVKHLDPSEAIKYTIDFIKTSNNWYHDYRNNLKSNFRNQQMIDYKNFIIDDIKHLDYEDFLENYYNTVDIYGLGLGLIYVLDYTQHLLPTIVGHNLRNLCMRMISTNPVKRIHINELLKLFEELMSSTANKHNVKFIDNIAIELSKKQINIEKKIMDAIIKNNKVREKISKEDLNIMHNKDPVHHKECPEGKYLNVDTNRCRKLLKIKECSTGKTRNPITGRCITNKINKTKKNITSNHPKQCVDGKEINPLTGRCIKIKKKVCKNGKEISPITGRCKTIKKQ